MTTPLRILYVSHYYPPEVNAPAVRISYLSRFWHTCGHKVSVVTGYPNHPTGIIPPQYRGKVFARESDDGVTVLRSPIYAAPNKGFARRLLNYLSFMISAIVSGVLRSGRQDIVIATSPQFFAAVAGYIISRFKRAPFVFEVRDVWPEEIVAVGVLKRGVVFWLLERIELFLYRKAALIVAVAQGTIEILTERGIPGDKIILCPNGVDFREFADNLDDHTIRDNLNLNGHFIVSYIGTHGLAHNLETVLEAAKMLRADKEIQFLFVGDGADKDRLIETSRRLALPNVTFVSQQPRSEVVHYYATSDLCLVPLRKAELFTRNIPSKIYEIMASGTPIVIGTEGESRHLVEEAQAGIAVEPENARALADAIHRLYHNRTLATAMGSNGRRFARTHCDRAAIAGEYLETLQTLVT